MKAAQLERLPDNLTRLRLFKSRERLEALLQEATGKEMSYADFLDCVLTEEILWSSIGRQAHPPRPSSQLDVVSAMPSPPFSAARQTGASAASRRTSGEKSGLEF